MRGGGAGQSKKDSVESAGEDQKLYRNLQHYADVSGLSPQQLLQMTKVATAHKR